MAEADIIVHARGAGCYFVEGVSAAGIALVNQFSIDPNGTAHFGCTSYDPFLRAVEQAGLEVSTR